MKLEYIKGKTANEILDILEMVEPPFNPYDIANKIQVKIKQDLDFDKLDTEGQIYINNNNEPEIWINPIKSENRRRFTLAHEIGHLVNDILPSVGNPIIDRYETLYRSSKIGGIETKANRFAAQLLMPAKYINQFLLDYMDKNPRPSAKEAISLVSAKFEVSKSAVFHRFKNLGIVAQDYEYPF